MDGKEIVEELDCRGWWRKGEGGGGGGRKIQCGTNRNKIQLMPGSRCWTEDGVREYPHAVDLSRPWD